MKPFEPHPLLRNPHLQTIAYALWRRRFPNLPPGIAREFETEPGTRIQGQCHWQPDYQRRPTVVIVHGLEGSTESQYMLGLADKAFARGWNAIRLNQRNCGGTEALSPSLYNSGLSGDFRAVLLELIRVDSLSEICFAGYSMGGNLVLKMAGELAREAPPQLRAVAAVCPALDLAACVDAVDLPQNVFYQRRFVTSLKERMRRKARLFPGVFDLARLDDIRSLRDFDDRITATYCGFENAADYYARSSAVRVVETISVPTLVLIARDDPFVPFSSFSAKGLTANPNITLDAPAHGGHCAFISKYAHERFWGEGRVMEFCGEISEAAARSGRG